MYLYIIGPENGPIKIGYSTNPDQRRQELQTGHPRKILVHYQAEVQENQARLLEAVVHKNNRHHVTKGEWFNLSIEDAKNEIDFAIIRWCDDITLKHEAKK